MMNEYIYRVERNAWASLIKSLRVKEIALISLVATVESPTLFMVTNCSSDELWTSSHYFLHPRKTTFTCANKNGALRNDLVHIVDGWRWWCSHKALKVEIKKIFLFICIFLCEIIPCPLCEVTVDGEKRLISLFLSREVYIHTKLIKNYS